RSYVHRRAPASPGPTPAAVNAQLNARVLEHTLHRNWMTGPRDRCFHRRPPFHTVRKSPAKAESNGNGGFPNRCDARLGRSRPTRLGRLFGDGEVQDEARAFAGLRVDVDGRVVVSE